MTSELWSAFDSKDDYTISAIAITIKDDLPIRFLLDIGAFRGNSIDKNLSNVLEFQGVAKNKCNHRLCSALSGLFQHSDGLNKFWLQYTNVLSE